MNDIKHPSAGEIGAKILNEGTCILSRLEALLHSTKDMEVMMQTISMHLVGQSETTRAIEINTRSVVEMLSLVEESHAKSMVIASAALEALQGY